MYWTLLLDIELLMSDRSLDDLERCHDSWNPADKSFIAEVPELPGCMADGATRREALANVERVIREWIETAQAEGRPVPRPAGHATLS